MTPGGGGSATSELYQRGRSKELVGLRDFSVITQMALGQFCEAEKNAFP